MKIYNEAKTEIIENPDLKLGRLKDDRIVIDIIPAQEEIKEEYHYEYVIYENGGRDRIKIIDTPYQPFKSEEKIYEDIRVYIPFTEKELNQLRIAELTLRLEKLSQDLIQALAGAIIEDLEARKLEFQTIHNEIRALQGKEARPYTKPISSEVVNAELTEPDIIEEEPIMEQPMEEELTPEVPQESVEE